MSKIEILNFDDEPPKAVIERSGRWSWYIHISHGLTRVDGWSAYGSESRAERKAQRVLSRYRLRDERHRNARVII